MGQQNNLVVTAGKNATGNLVQLPTDGTGTSAGNVKVSTQGTVTTTAAGEPYATVAASQTKQLLGAAGAVGDVLDTVVIVPATTSPGIVEVYDSTGGPAIVLFPGGATSVASLAPITVKLNAKSATGGWYVTTGANVSAIVIGKFT